MTTPSNLQSLLDKTREIESKATPDGYKVLPDGRVFAISTNWRGWGYGERLMAQDLNAHGYPRVRLTVNGSRKTYLVHKLVALQFLGPKPTPSHEVCHNDGNKENNHVSNLRWGTRSENAQDRKLHGTERAPENGRKSAHKLVKTKCLHGHNYSIGSTGLKKCVPCQNFHNSKRGKKMTLKELLETTRRLSDSATPGPWIAANQVSEEYKRIEVYEIAAGEDGPLICQLDPDSDCEVNQKFIAHARNVIAILCEIVEVQREALDIITVSSLDAPEYATTALTRCDELAAKVTP